MERITHSPSLTDHSLDYYSWSFSLTPPFSPSRKEKSFSESAGPQLDRFAQFAITPPSPSFPAVQGHSKSKPKSNTTPRLPFSRPRAPSPILLSALLLNYGQRRKMSSGLPLLSSIGVKPRKIGCRTKPTVHHLPYPLLLQLPDNLGGKIHLVMRRSNTRPK